MPVREEHDGCCTKTGTRSVALVFVVSSFIGIEATVIFGEEARDPAPTIKRAAYISVALISIFYALSTWAIAVHYGPAQIVAEATENPATLSLRAVESLFGRVHALAMNVLLITSLCACALSFHNTINRYLFAVGREGLIKTLGLAASMPHQQSSTAQDLARGKPSEIDFPNGFIVRKGEQYGISTPTNHALQVMVKLVERTGAR